MATHFESAYPRVHHEHAKRMAPSFEPGTDVTWRDKAGDLHLGTVETDLGDGTYEVVISWDERGYVETVEPVAGQDLTELATVEWAEAVEAVSAGINLEDDLNARCDEADHAGIMAAKRDLDPYEYGFDLGAGRTLSEIIDSRRAGASTLVHRKTDGGTINAGRGAETGEATVNTGHPPSNLTWLDTVDQTVVERLLDRLDREFPDQEW